ncbi:MAG TPA: UDP-glucuronic acid decarboxylase family protein [Bacillota bacterium]|nr:UDP-glucuronic acid decarboxylase family protein [Bacillota bacterium]
MGLMLVAGGAGFVGANLCRKLLATSHEVCCLDSLVTGRQSNIESLRGLPAFTFIGRDITQPLDLDIRPEVIFNLASPASPRDYLRHPIETLAAGAFGTHRLLELARRTRAIFVLASTSEVYGDPEIHPQPEAYWGRVNPIGPRSVYDEAKRFAEAMTMAFHREYGTRVRIARIFNTYGPFMRPDDGRVVSNFCWQAIHGLPLTVYGDGRQTRSFCYVADLVEALCQLPEVDHAAPVNLGNPAETDILSLAERIIAISSSQSRVTFLPLPTDDPRIRCPDIQLARSILAWEPRMSLEEGLKQTIAYFRALARGVVTD